MADYYPLLAKAVAAQAQSDPDKRRAIYERARSALLGQLRAIQPPVPEPEPVATPDPPAGEEERLDPTRYGDWEKKGIAIDF